MSGWGRVRRQKSLKEGINGYIPLTKSTLFVETT